MKTLEEKHRFATRWFHWVNFPILSAMIFSGMLIYWAYDPYRIGIGSISLFHFFPIGSITSPVSTHSWRAAWLCISHSRGFLR